MIVALYIIYGLLALVIGFLSARMVYQEGAEWAPARSAPHAWFAFVLFGFVWPFYVVLVVALMITETRPWRKLRITERLFG